MLIANCTAKLLVDLEVMKMPYRGYLQGALFSDGYWWLCSAQEDLAGSEGEQSNHISKFDKKGKYLGRMTLLGSGHGSAFAMDGSDVVIAWFESGGRRIRKITWEKNAKAKRGDADVVNTGTGQQAWIATPLTGSSLNDFCIRRFRDDLSPDHDQFSLRYWNAPSTVRRRMMCPQVKPTTDKEPDGTPISNPSATYQGSISWGDSVFALYAGTRARPQRIAQYRWPGDNAQEYTVKAISTLDITNIPAGWKNWTGSHEPEGLCIYDNHLCFGCRFGPTSNRYFQIFMLTEKGAPAPVTPPPPTPVTPPWPPKPDPLPPVTDLCAPAPVPQDEPWIEP